MNKKCLVLIILLLHFSIYSTASAALLCEHNTLILPYNTKKITVNNEIRAASTKIDEIKFDEACDYYNNETIQSIYQGNNPSEVILPAIEKFKKFIQEYPSSSLADDAQLIIGGISQWTKDGLYSRNELQKVIDMYPNSQISEKTFPFISLSLPPRYDIKELLKIPTDAYAKLLIAYTYNDINDYPNDIDYNKSSELLKLFINEYPNSPLAPTVQYDIGLNYTWLNSPLKAIEAFRKLIDTYPDETYYVGLSYNFIGKNLIKRYDGFGLDQYADELANKYSRDNYIAECNFGNSLQFPNIWLKKSFTVKVDDKSINSEQKLLIQDALNEWTERTSGEFNFTLVNEGIIRQQPEENGIDFFFEVKDLYGPAGQTLNSISNVTNFRGAIYSSIVSIQKGYTNEYFRFVALHEIGHALGLGHSFNRKDVMIYGMHKGDSHLSQRDLNTLFGLYNIDSTKPNLIIDVPVNNFETNQEIISIKGKTEVGSIVKVYGSEVIVGPLGDFTTSIALNSGINEITITAMDAAGNIESKSLRITLDQVSPTIEVNNLGGYYNKDLSITLNPSEEGDIYYTIDKQNPTIKSNQYDNSISITTTTTLKYFIIDRAGNRSPIYKQEYIIDKKPPNVTIKIKKILKKCYVTFKLSEPGTIYYTINGLEPTVKSSKYTKTIILSGGTTIKYLSIDRAGNKSKIYSRKI